MRWHVGVHTNKQIVVTHVAPLCNCILVTPSRLSSRRLLFGAPSNSESASSEQHQQHQQQQQQPSSPPSTTAMTASASSVASNASPARPTPIPLSQLPCSPTPSKSLLAIGASPASKFQSQHLASPRINLGPMSPFRSPRGKGAKTNELELFFRKVAYLLCKLIGCL
jgi:hypothetical protein